jgi:hypothetical protein
MCPDPRSWGGRSASSVATSQEKALVRRHSIHYSAADPLFGVLDGVIGAIAAKSRIRLAGALLGRQFEWPTCTLGRDLHFTAMGVAIRRSYGSWPFERGNPQGHEHIRLSTHRI